MSGSRNLVAGACALALTALVGAAGCEQILGVDEPTLRAGEPCEGETMCHSGRCVDGVCCEADCDVCGADGRCRAAVGQPCTSGGECQSSHCVDGVCCDGAGACKLGDGEPCASGGQCASTHCVDGTCCGTPCDGLCEACDRAKNGRANGACGPVVASTDPDEECDGEGACDGTGACKLGVGQPCTDGAECLLPLCVDGVCCDSPCDGVCEACSARAKGGGPGGVCGPAEQASPDSACPGSTTCGVDGTCALFDNGGACALGVECVNGVCADGACQCMAQIAAGGVHICAVPLSGAASCWGANGAGQTGVGNQTPTIAEPSLVAGLNGAVVQIAGGGAHSCARTGSALWCWGNNSQGQIGDGTAGSVKVQPTQVTALGGDVVDVDCGAEHTCARRSDGSLWCWGLNIEGQIGDGTTTFPKPLPVEVTALGKEVLAVALGDSHSCALLSGGSVWCWGDNPSGQLGDGTIGAPKPSPAPVPALASGVLEIAAGGNQTCARTADTLWCWGANGEGQVGDGSSGAPKSSPVAVALAGSDVTRIVTAPGRTCALKSDGTVWCWGQNNWGQLGDGTFMKSPLPVQVLGLGGSVLEISAGAEFTCARRLDSVIVCWGRNQFAQLGTGVASAAVPQPVSTILECP